MKGNQKAPFSIALHWGVEEGATPFPGLLHFTLDMYLIMLSVKQRSIKYYFFESLAWLKLGLNPVSPAIGKALPTKLSLT